jgi:anti-sigma B factor antagonist
MKIDQQTVDNGCVIQLKGRLDAANAHLLRDRLTTGCIECAAIVVDFSAVEFMDSTGLGVLVGSVHRLRALHRDLKLACLPPPVRRVLELTGADRLFDIYDDPGAALKGAA